MARVLAEEAVPQDARGGHRHTEVGAKVPRTKTPGQEKEGSNGHQSFYQRLHHPQRSGDSREPSFPGHREGALAEAAGEPAADSCTGPVMAGVPRHVPGGVPRAAPPAPRPPRAQVPPRALAAGQEAVRAQSTR